MAIRLKANIGYQPIVEEVSRKFVPRKETCSAGGAVGPVVVESKGWMGGAVRKSGRAGLGACTRNYLVIRANARQSSASQSELTARVTFAEAVAGRNHIMQDLAQIVRVQEMFVTASQDPAKLVNNVAAKGYTFSGWIMAVQYRGIAAAKEAGTTYDANTFPQNFD